MTQQAYKATFKPGDVLGYIPTGGSHARECVAIVQEKGAPMDTFWGESWSSGGHILSEKELATASFRFRLSDYRKLGESWERKHDEWMTYAPADRQVITAQHGLQPTYYIRIGAEPDLGTQIANAQEAVQEAESAVASAQSRLEWRREDLAKLEAQRA